MQSKEQSSKISFYNQWVATALFIKGQFVCSSIMEVCFMAISSLQTLMMIIHPTLSLNRDISVNSSLEVLYTFLIRPEIFVLINRGMQQELVYLFILAIVVIHKVAFLILTLLLQMNNYSDKFLQQIQHSLPIQIFINFQSYYQQLLCPLCIVPFNTLILISIKESTRLILQGDSIKFIHLIFASITFVVLQIDQLLICTINKKPISFKLKQMEASTVTQSHLIIYILQTIAIAIYTLMEKTVAVVIIQCLIILLIQTLAIRNQYVNCIYIFRYQEICLYSGYIFQLIYSVLQLINTYQQINNSYFFLLTITPLLLAFILESLNRTKHKQFLLFFNEEIQNVKIIITVLINILNKNDIQENNIVMRSSLINYYHSKTCVLKHCGCVTTFYIAEPKQANAITSKILKQFLFEKIQQVKKAIYQKNSRFYCSQEMLIQYSILLYDFGWMMLAARSFNKLLLNDNKVPGSLNTAAIDKNELARQTKEMTIKSATLLYKKFQSMDEEKEKQAKNEMKIYFQIELGIINKQRIVLLSNETKWKMKATFGSSLNAAQQTFISDSLNQYLNYEFVIQHCKERLINLLTQKNLFYQEMLKQKQNQKRIYKKTVKLCELLNEDEQYIRNQFEKYPSPRLQKALTFFYCEIMNNEIQANRTYIQSINSDLQFISNNHSALTLSQQQSAYVILSLNEDLKHLEVQNISNQLLKLIGKPNSINTCFGEILPLFFYQYHPMMVNEFLAAGKSRYYRNFSPNFVNVHDCLVKGIQLCYDTTLLFKHQQLVFVAFLQGLAYENSYIIVDGFDRNFISLSYNFLFNIGYDDNLIKRMIKHKYLNDISIYDIFPQFDDALFRQEQDNRILTEEIYFFDYLKIRKSTVVEQKEKRVSNLNPVVWKQKEKVMSFVARLNITKREHANFHYFVIEISSLQRQQTPLTNYDEILSEIESETEKNSSGSSSSSVLLKSLSDDQPNQVNILEINEQFNLFSPAIIKNMNQINTSTRQLATQTRFTIANQSEDKLLKNFTEIKANVDPNTRTQQAFYDSKLSHLVASQDKFSVILDQEIESDGKDKGEEKKQNYAQSQSSVASINVSVNYKKYELIEKITASRPPIKISQFIGFILFQNFIIIIYLILVLVLMPTDLNNSKEELTMIGFHADVMAPHDLFFSMRITISSYSDMLSKGFINKTTFQALVEPYYKNIHIGYEELKDSLLISLSNPYLQPFYNDYNLLVKLMDENDTSITTQQLSFREVLLTILQYQFAYMRTYESRQSPSGSSYQVFLYANYFNIHDLLEQISGDILQYSKDRSLAVKQKWLILWLVLMLLVIIISLIIFYYYHEHLQQFDKFLSLLNYFTPPILESEISKQKILLQLIQHDENAIFDYEFNFERNQAKLENGSSNHHTQMRDLKSKKRYKISRILAIVIVTLLASLFIAYSTIVDQFNQNFFDKYLLTTDFYKEIADLKLRAGGIILQKEIFYRLSNFTYLTSHDVDRLYFLVDEALIVMQNYILQVSEYDFSNLLVSNQFIALFTTIQEENLCENLTETFKTFMYEQCNQAFEGTLKEGTIQSLSYLINQVKAEQALNNFTQRVELHPYEQEGSQVITRVFSSLSSSLSDAIENIIQSSFYFSEFLSIIFFIFTIILSIGVLKWFRRSLIQQHHLIKKIVNLAPSQILISNESYERQLRLMAQQQELY